MRTNKHKPDEQVPLLLGVDDAAQRLGVGRSSIYRLIEEGDLQRVKVGKRALIPDSSIREYVDKLVTS